MPGLPFIAIIRHDYPYESIHVGCDNFCFRLWSDGLAIYQLVEEKHKNEIPRDDGGMDVQGSEVKPSHSLLGFRQRAIGVFQPYESPKEVPS